MAGLKSKYSVYVVFAGKKVKMPVNPEEVNIKYPTDHKTYNVIGVGEIVVPRKPSLKELSWESFFPGNRKAPYVNSGAKNVSFYVKKFEKALKSKKICRVIISRSGMQNTNVRCIISNFELIDKGGEPETNIIRLTLKNIVLMIRRSCRSLQYHRKTLVKQKVDRQLLKQEQTPPDQWIRRYLE